MPEETEALAPNEEQTRLTLEVSVEEPSACERHITVTISREDVDRYFERFLGEMMPTAAVPGFRPGRAPKKLVENRFRKEIAEQVKGSILMDSMTQVTEEQEFSAISEPDFDFDAVEVPQEGPMKFEFDLEVRPDFDLPDWKGLKLKRPMREFTREDVDDQLKKVLARYAEVAEKDGKAAMGDQISTEIEFLHNDKQIAEMGEEMLTLRPVLSFADGKLEDFGKLAKGAKAGGTFEGKVTLSTEIHNEDLRGEEVTAKFKVNSVWESQLPELNSEMLEKIGDFQSEGDLRDIVNDGLQRQLGYAQQREIRNQITSLLVESATWELPPDLLRRQSYRELERAVLELQASGFSEEEIRAHENELRQNSRENTSRALKEHFILERIAEDEDIDVVPSDYDEEINMIAAQRNENPRRVRAQLEKRGMMDSLRNQIIERHVINKIRDAAEFEDVPYEMEENKVEAIPFAIAGEEEPEVVRAPGSPESESAE